MNGQWTILARLSANGSSMGCCVFLPRCVDAIQALVSGGRKQLLKGWCLMDKQGRTISFAEDTVHRENAPKKELRQSVLSYRYASQVSGGL